MSRFSSGAMLVQRLAMPSQYSPQSGSKRRKLDAGAALSEADQLRAWLTFEQNASALKQGVNKFKGFLLSVGQAENEDDKAERLRVLKAYCDSQSTRRGGRHSDGDVVSCLPDLVQTWRFADSNNVESLLTVVPAVLALLLKTISTELDFRAFGVALCSSLLSKDQLRLVNRGLTAAKTREHLISPCVRLLTEVVSFDGGAVASLLYAKRDVTFKRIEVFLTPNKAQLEAQHDERPQRSTLRRNAQRYVLANLTFQGAAAKSDIIAQHAIVKALLEHIKKDPADIVLDTLQTVDRHLVQDDSIPRSLKTKFFSRANLERLVTLYGYARASSDKPARDDDDDDDIDINNDSNSQRSVAHKVHAMLLKICQTSSLGVLLSDTGWYPLGSDPETLLVEHARPASIELGLDSAAYLDRYRESVPVRNGILSHLAQILRPDADSLQIELLLAIFKAAPELVADFFTKKTSMFVSDPKPTAAWMAESALLFSIVQLPPPANLGWTDKLPPMPPPVSVVIENILPRPLTPRVLSRCLNQNAEIVTLFAVRILIAAFAKLQKVLDLFCADHRRQTTAAAAFWNQAASKLIAEFCRRCPPMKDVALLYKRTAQEDLPQQDAVAELLACFFTVIPDVALEESLDVSLSLVDVLKRLDTLGPSNDDSDLLLSQLHSLVNIAQRSASMRWWQRPATMQYSAFTSILKVLVGATRRANSLQQIRQLLHSVLVESSILLASPESFAALLASLDHSDTANHVLAAQLSFLDNCVCRVAKKPVHYRDLADALTTAAEGQSGNISPLVAALTEQWPFVIGTQSPPEKDRSAPHHVAAFIASFLGRLKQAGEDKSGLKAARDALALSCAKDKALLSLFKKSLKSSTGAHGPKDDDNNNNNNNDNDDDDLAGHQARAGRPNAVPSASVGKADTLDLDEVFGPLPVEAETHNALLKWKTVELDAAIEQNHIAELMRCLCSAHEEVRRQAFVGLGHFMMKLQESKFTELRSIYLLAGELLETVKCVGLETPVPWTVGACAASCLAVLTDPLHKLFGKVNKFLQRAPVWDVGKLPAYWMNKILLNEPELDNGYFEELSWLLDLLVSGLRTNADMEIYRRANVFERVLSLYSSPSIGVSARHKILLLVYRAVQVGGSTTLITRAAIVSWIQGQLPLLQDQQQVAVLKALAAALYRTADSSQTDQWSGGTLGHLIRDLTDSHG